MPPKKDLQCFTKKANDGHKYVACIGSKKKEGPKEKEKEKPKVKRKTNIKVMRQQGPRNLKKGFGIKRAPETKKKPERSRLQKLTGITPQEANKMDPSKLFGLLPVALRKKVLKSGNIKF
tara:strand:+ start:1874 stop:2233 length:360 start_codon:yes stop_codon:yes gene_type:complete